MAEVMTDNDHAVAKILESYEIAETGESENELNVVQEGQGTEMGEGSGQTVACELAKQSCGQRKGGVPLVRHQPKGCVPVGGRK